MFNENIPIYDQLFKKNFYRHLQSVLKELVVKHGMFDKKNANAKIMIYG